MDKSVIEKQSAMVVKGNDLIWNARFSLTTQQQKIVIALISQIDENKSVREPYTFEIAKFCKMCGLGRADGRYYAKVKSDLLHLRNKGVYRKMDDGRETTVSWLMKVDIAPKNGIVTVYFDWDMEDVLFNLKRRFVKYGLEYILPMENKYSIRLYELLKSYEFQGRKKVIELNELKMCVDGDKYESTKDFRKRVLEPALKEINQYTDIEVSAEPVFEGRTITAFQFTIDSIQGNWIEIERRRVLRYEKLGIEV